MGTLAVIQWPSTYRKTLVIIVTALVVVGAALAAILLFNPSEPEDSTKTVKGGGPVINDPDSRFSITLSKGWRVERERDGVTALANAKLGAELVFTIGQRETLKKFAEEYNERAENLPGYKGEPGWEKSSDKLGPIEKVYSFREDDAGKETWVMVRAVSIDGKIIWFELKSDLDGWSSAYQNFLNAWKTVKAG